MVKLTLYFLLSAVLAGIFAPGVTSSKVSAPARVLFRNAIVIDGNGGQPLEHTDILVEEGTISAIGQHLSDAGAKTIDLSGKTIMPSLISTHTHIGNLKYTAPKPENYTRQNILSQLIKYESYGVSNILVMGTDRPMLFNTGLRDSSLHGLLPGARIHSAGYGFGVPQGGPPLAMAMDQVYRPASPEEVPAQIDSLAALKPAVVKIWVDDFNGKYKKMDPAIYKMIIAEAHKHGLRVAAHVYYLSDARQLVASGLDIIAHSVRDSVIDDALIAQMKAKHVMYIPTLSLDEFAYVYARRPEWINDDFFKISLEPGVYEKIISPQYQDSLKNAPDYNKNVAAFETALKNVKKLHDAGILISMGTDSGAMAIRAQGFSEHLELELLVQAGLTPLQAITVATKNAAQLLKLDKKYGTLEKGKIADMIVLSDNPAINIKNTRTIEAVYKAGQEVSQGPVTGRSVTDKQ